jgi:hypothetical protein
MSAPEQKDLGWVRNATPREIADAVAAGELSGVLAGEAPAPLTDEEIGGMSAAELVERAQHDPDLERRLGTTDSPATPSADQGARGPKPDSPIAGKSPDEVRAMYRAGDLDDWIRNR